MAGEIYYVVAPDKNRAHLFASNGLTDFRKALDVSLEYGDSAMGAPIFTLVAGEVISVVCICGMEFTLSNPPPDLSQAFE